MPGNKMLYFNCLKEEEVIILSDSDAMTVRAILLFVRELD
jgi:hypothetical protein